MAGKTVLVVEDNTIHREELATTPRRHGFRILAASDGNEAMSWLSGGPIPDLVLLDMLVPSGDYDGWWFLQQRQHVPELAAIPVLILTSLAVASQAWAASLGAAGLVRKPFESDALLEKIRRCLGDAGQG